MALAACAPRGGAGAPPPIPSAQDSARAAAGLPDVTTIPPIHVSPRAAATVTMDFWGLVGDLELDRAAAVAATPAQARLIDGLRDAMGGDRARAERVLDSLSGPAVTDTTVGRVARLVYAGLLQGEYRWRELRALERAEARPVLNTADRADVSAWARAFATAPAPGVRFRVDSTVFPVVLSTLGVPMLPVQLNGHRFLFWLDTGASLTMVAADVAAEAGITPLGTDTLEAATAVGRVPVRAAVIHQARVGPLELADVPAMIVAGGQFRVRDSTAHQAGQAKIDGVIGWDLLRRLDVRVDYARGRLEMRRPRDERLPFARRNLLWLGYPIVRAVAADGTVLHLGLDTGLQESFVTAILPGRLGLTPVAMDRRRIGAIGADSLLRVEVLPAVAMNVGDAGLLLRRVVVYAAEYASLVPLDGVLGSDVGRDGGIRIDPTNGIYRITIPE